MHQQLWRIIKIFEKFVELLNFVLCVLATGAFFDGGRSGLLGYGVPTAGGHTAVCLRWLSNALSGPVALLRLRADGRERFYQWGAGYQSASPSRFNPAGSGQQAALSLEQF